MVEIIRALLCRYFRDGRRHWKVREWDRRRVGGNLCSSFGIMFRVVCRTAKVRVDVHLQFRGFVKVDSVELKVIFVEGIVIIVIDLVIALFVVFICCRCHAQCQMATCVDFQSCSVFEVGKLIAVCREGRFCITLESAHGVGDLVLTF